MLTNMKQMLNTDQLCITQSAQI